MRIQRKAAGTSSYAKSIYAHAEIWAVADKSEAKVKAMADALKAAGFRDNDYIEETEDFNWEIEFEVDKNDHAEFVAVYKNLKKTLKN